MNTDVNIIKNANKIYNEAVNKYGDCSSAVLWDDQQTQYLRFHQLVKHIDFVDSTTVLDIGCGNAELYKYLNFVGFKGKYEGFDINDSLLQLAKNKYKNICVQNVNILNHNISKKYDYVVLSGFFNSNYGQDIQWIHKMLLAMNSLCTKKIIFNAISSYVNFRDSSLYYIDPKDILDFSIQNISANITIAHGELPYNFTCIIDKSQTWSSINRV